MNTLDAAIGDAEEPARPPDAGNLLIRRLKISGMLSFGPKGIDMPMGPLNVLIGPNGSGKSNFIEALALLQAAPRELTAPVKRMGGISEWLWKGDGSTRTATIEATVNLPPGGMPLLHRLEFTEHGTRFELTGETIGYASTQINLDGGERLYHFADGSAVLSGEPLSFPGQFSSQFDRGFSSDDLSMEESILSQVRDPEAYPFLRWLQQRYSAIRLYRNWEFGPDADLRQSPRADEPSTFLTERGKNLPLALSRLRGDSRQMFFKSLQQLYDGIEDFQVEVGGGRAELFVVERGAGERYIPASRLSDGTLRYMALAAILLDPEPPPLVVIEEPELGLHPDVVLGIGEMLVKASKRTQLVVTTHSRVLINALEDDVSSVVVCEKYDGESRFERLDPEHLSIWLEKYSLGYLWSTGEIRGNRW